ncbi:MAG: sigma-54-dependent transcriptional regulator [Bacteroidota bacterium]
MSTTRPPLASILVVDDELDFRSMLLNLLTPIGYAVTAAEDGTAAINELQKKRYNLVLLDIRMPRIDGIEVLEFVKAQYPDTEVIMLTGVGEVRIAVECMQKGAFHFLEKPYSVDELLSVVVKSLDRQNLSIENKVLKSEIRRLAQSSNLIGESDAFKKVIELAAKVAPTDSTALLQGASGTGKELFATFLHKNSTRGEKPFVALNCASIPDTLIESELFGHEKGSFTDAVTMRQGLVEIANGGTLFLDEIGEISTAFQPKLLRFIQTGEYRRIGGNKNLHTDVRIISATNKDLMEEVAAGRFREDLLYRLNVITIQIPSLSERKDDIILLATEILRKKAGQRTPKQLHPDATQSLLEYRWPGNVRELENVLERAIILANGEIIMPRDLVLPAHFVPVSASPDQGDGLVGSAISLKELEREHISRVLANTKWNKNLASKILGISLKTLYTKIHEFQLTEV